MFESIKTYNPYARNRSDTKSKDPYTIIVARVDYDSHNDLCIIFMTNHSNILLTPLTCICVENFTYNIISMTKVMQSSILSSDLFIGYSRVDLVWV